MNVWAVINIPQRRIVAEATHYQEAARISNDLDEPLHAEMKARGVKCYTLPHTLCRLDSLYLHERQYGKLS